LTKKKKKKPLMKKNVLSVSFAASGTADEDLINDTEFTQPCLFAFEYALAQLNCQNELLSRQSPASISHFVEALDSKLAR
jgi:acyl transferase domain-containing protein